MDFTGQNFVSLSRDQSEHFHGTEAGYDTYFSFAEGSIEINLVAGRAIGPGFALDTFTSVEAAHGGAGNDTIIGNEYINILWGYNGNDHLIGGGGDDPLNGGAGADILDGGAGDADIADYTTFSSVGVTADLANPKSNTGDAAGDIYIGIENISGTIYSDILRGDAGDNWISGGNGFPGPEEGDDLLAGRAGNDYLQGEGGNDRLIGGRGDDVVVGGTGADVFVLEHAGGRDTIIDFSIADGDIIEVAPGMRLRSFTETDANLDGRMDTVLVFNANTSVTVEGVVGVSDWGMFIV